MTYYDRLRTTAAVLTISMFAGFVLLARARSVPTPYLGLVAVIAASAAYWLAINHMAEGAILVQVSRDHGLTVADLVALAGLGEAAALTVRCLNA